jgi:hypothetical protein
VKVERKLLKTAKNLGKQEFAPGFERFLALAESF